MDSCILDTTEVGKKRERVPVYQLYIGKIKFRISETEKKSLNSEALGQIYKEQSTG